MKRLCLLILLCAWPSARAGVVYVSPVTEPRVWAAPIDRKVFMEVVEGYAKAARLPEKRSAGGLELRIWRKGLMSGEGVGHVIRADHIESFSTKQQDGHYRAVRLKNRKARPSSSLLNALQAVSQMGDRAYACGVFDGEVVLIDAVLDGQPLMIEANNPAVCADRWSKAVAHLLAEVQLMAEGARR